MKKTTNLIINLIKREICGGANSHIQISNDLIKQLYIIAKSQDISHVMGNALFKSGAQLDDECKSKFEKDILTAKYRYVMLENELKSICEAFEKAKISYMPLKGAIIRKYYTEPWMRTSGDIDVLVHDVDTEMASDILVSKLGYKLEKKLSYNVSLFSPADTHVELHFSLVDDVQSDKIFADIWSSAYPEESYEYRYAMTNEMFYAYHVAHMAKHFKNGGCGIRPFIDLWVMNNKMDIDMAVTENIIEKCGLLEFYRQVNLLCGVWFGDETNIHTELTRDMEDYVLKSGIYGTVENQSTIAQIRRGGKFKYLLYRMFMPYSKLKTYYPRLEKYPILLPYYHIKRWCRGIFTSARKKAISDIKHNNAVIPEKRDRLEKMFNALNLIS